MGISLGEAKALLYKETPVFFAGIKYNKISGLILRKRFFQIEASAELLDKTKKSVVIVPLKWIDPCDEQKIIEEGVEDYDMITSMIEKKLGEFIDVLRQEKKKEVNSKIKETMALLMNLHEITKEE